MPRGRLDGNGLADRRCGMPETAPIPPIAARPKRPLRAIDWAFFDARDKARRHAKACRKWLSPPPYNLTHPRTNTTTQRVADFFMPWREFEYPGRRKGFTELCRARSWHTVRDWIRGRSPIPVATAEHLATLLDARATLATALAAELRAEVAARPVKPAPARLAKLKRIAEANTPRHD